MLLPCCLLLLRTACSELPEAWKSLFAAWRANDRKRGCLLLHQIFHQKTMGNTLSLCAAEQVCRRLWLQRHEVQHRRGGLAALVLQHGPHARFGAHDDRPFR